MKPDRLTAVLTPPINICPALATIAFLIRGFSYSNLLGLRTRIAVASRPL